MESNHALHTEAEFYRLVAQPHALPIHRKGPRLPATWERPRMFIRPTRHVRARAIEIPTTRSLEPGVVIETTTACLPRKCSATELTGQMAGNHVLETYTSRCALLSREAVQPCTLIALNGGCPRCRLPCPCEHHPVSRRSCRPLQLSTHDWRRAGTFEVHTLRYHQFSKLRREALPLHSP